MFIQIIKKYWFLAGLVFVFIITTADFTETVAKTGILFKSHKGPEIVIFGIFFLSGLVLKTDQIKSGFADINGTITALILIFVAAPLIAVLFGLSNLSTGIKIGIFLVAVMPTTLSSGIVMTHSAGGNMAHALLITIIANMIAVFSIPVSLSILLNLAGDTTNIQIDKLAIMVKIGLLVLLPLFSGLFARYLFKNFTSGLKNKPQIINQFLILIIVWMALSQSRQTIVDSGSIVILIFFIVALFHGALLTFAFLFIKINNIKKGRRESVIFMGAQKTLPLSVIIQVSLFPDFGLALVVCVMHHIVHLLIDGYLVGKLK